MIHNWNVAGGGIISKEATKREIEKGYFVNFTIRKSRSTGKRDKDNKTIYETDFMDCECFVPKTDAGNSMMENVFPRLKSRAEIFFVNSELYVSQWEDKEGGKRSTPKFKFPSLYSISIYKEAPADTPSSSGDDEDSPF